MKICRVNLAGCGAETDTTVVIDVLRAFTTAAAVFAAGAEKIIPVGEISDAFRLKAQFPGSLLMGEDGGRFIPGFDFSNSPAQFKSIDLGGRMLIQRTSNGTQGLIGSLASTRLLACSLVCASATVRLLQQIQPRSLTLVETGRFPGGYGLEDTACADLVSDLLLGRSLNADEIQAKALSSSTVRTFLNPDDLHHLQSDLELSLQVDVYDFAMQVFPENGLPVLRSVEV